jgi:ABC-2 type transport system ATP-binding protein
MDENAITIKNLTKSFKDVKVLEGINLEIKKGSIFALLGPNGAGKTTTIRILSTLLLPDSGEITINGLDVVKQADQVRGIIGLTGQFTAIDELLTGKENLEMIGRLYHLSLKDVKKRAVELLRQFDLVDAANRPAKTYSGGMRRRLDLAASLIASPPIIFLDEPTTGLDPRSRLVVWDTVKELVKAGITILLTTQYLEEADILADRIAVIDKGIVIAEGSSNELKQQVGKERLEFTIAKESDFSKATQIILGEAQQIDEEARLISIATEGSAVEIKDMLSAIENAQIKIDSLALHKPTLDDVFLKLTGHQAEEKKEEKS